MQLLSQFSSYETEEIHCVYGQICQFFVVSNVATFPQFHNCQSSCHNKLKLPMSYSSIYAQILKVQLTFLSKDYSNISSQKSQTYLYVHQ